MAIERPQSRQPIPSDARKVFSGVLFDVYQWEQELYDGTTATFEKLKRADTVSVVPILPGNRILLVEDTQPGRDTVITFPGGRIDPGEDAETAARRELREETGYEARELLLLKAFQPVSKVDWVLYFFVARGCEKMTEPHLDAGERITSKIMSLDELIGLIHDERFPAQDLKLELLEAQYSAEARRKLEKQLFGE